MSYHDELGAQALRICDDIREVSPFRLHEQLMRSCKADPDRMAQIVMCLAMWVDVDGPVRNLVARAEEVAEANFRVQERMVPDEDALREVLLRHPVDADGQVLEEGTRHVARPVADEQWELVAFGVKVPEAWILRGGQLRRTLLRRRDAHEEYEFARTQLGYGHAEALRWLRERFGVTERQLFRWQFANPRTEVSA